MRLAAPPAALALAAAALLAGCGSSSGGTTSTGSTAAPKPGSSTAPAGASARSCEAPATGIRELRAAGVSCREARRAMLAWRRDPACAAPSSASRTSCTARSYRCLGARTARGLAVGCARPGRSIAFVVER